tara:strand:- start:76 stop:414 length:339 start_codon:yes stop_codon:yes gene_type:complete
VHIQTISRFLRNHFHSGPQRVKRLRERRLIIQVAGLHCSSGGKLPNAYKGRFDITTSQLALNMSHAKVLKQATLINTIINKVIIVLNKFKNKVFFMFLRKIIIEFILIVNMN